MHAEFFFNTSCRVGHMSHLTIARSPAAGHDAERAGLSRPGLAGLGQKRVDTVEAILRNLGLRNSRLRAVAAILRAQPTFCVSQQVKLHIIPVMPPPNAIR